MSMSGDDLDRAQKVIEVVTDEVAEKILSASVDPGFIGAALVVTGANLINENDGPDEAVHLLEGLIETLEARPKRPVLHVVSDTENPTRRRARRRL